jgi:JAB1/Mov34/MPN/PAD-1 ubiquitin protease
MKENTEENDTMALSSKLCGVLQKLSVTDVIVHPLVLLSVADHYHRVARGTRKRVIGILLGQSLSGGTIDITNSFAIPFEEDMKHPVRVYIDIFIYMARFVCCV